LAKGESKDATVVESNASRVADATVGDANSLAPPSDATAADANSLAPPSDATVGDATSLVPPSDATAGDATSPPSHATPRGVLGVSATGVQGSNLQVTHLQDVSAAVPPGAETPGGLPAIPGYELIAEVGRGGMGVVYKARQVNVNRLVAVKMVLGERYARLDDQVRFRVEAEMAARVRHPNVVQVYESGAVAGQPYQVLEWVEGGTLAGYLKGRLQTANVCARTVELLARAIHVAHCNGVVHRDLKPGNVLMASAGGTGSSSALGVAVSGTARTRTRLTFRDALSVTLAVDGRPVTLTPKIADFGLAKQLVGATHQTQTGKILGTPAYMAPEQAEGRTRAIGPATDTYALGVILYEMMIGRTPFRGETPVVVLRRIVEEQPAAPRQHNRKLPRDLETICLKCLAKDPASRYATAEALADDLDHFLQNKPIAARPAGVLERAWKWAERRPAVATLAACAASFFVIGFAGITWQWRAAVHERDRAESAERLVRTEKATTDAVNRFLVQDLLETATPQKALGRQVTVREVLQNAAARVGGAFTEQPEVDASVRLALGNSYRKLGEYAEAAKYLDSALALRQKRLGPAHRDTLAASADRAQLLAEQSRFDEAIPLLRQIVADARTNLGAEDTVTLECLGRLALALQHHGDQTEAETLFQQALAVCRRLFGPDDLRTFAVLNDLGILLRAQAKLPQAEVVFRQAADGRAKALTAKHPDALESLGNLAQVINDQGRWQDAKPLYQQVLDAKRQVLGRWHPDTLWAMNNLAQLLDTHGEYDAGLVLYEDALEEFRSVLGPENPQTLKVLSNLGQLCFRLYRRDSRPELIDRAVSTLAAVHDIRRRVLSPDHPDTLQAASDLAVVLFVKGDRDEAERLMEEAVAGYRKTLGPGHADTLNAVDNYAQFLIGGRPPQLAKATKLLSDAWSAAEKEKTSDTPRALGLLNTYVEVLLRQKKGGEALPLAGQAATDTAKTMGESSAATIRARRNLGTILLDLNRAPDAEPHLKAAYLAARNEFGLQNSRTAQAAGKYGACLLAQRKYDEAEEPLLSSYRVLSQFKQAPPLQVREACEQVVRLYDQWGKPDKADEYRAKLR
jgi:serine/threonine protein kinase/Tfp pilus assembly protein PilF